MRISGKTKGSILVSVRTVQTMFYFPENEADVLYDYTPYSDWFHDKNEKHRWNRN